MPTYRLETFGKLALSGGATGTLSHQRRRLALLALLAASGDRGMSRDQLIGCLWADSTTENGRHSLEQLLHALRRALGDSAFSGTNPVGLNSEVVASDVADFERLLACGDRAAAVDMYSGPFLQGFYLDNAPEFERWSTTERTRLATRYEDALSHLASDAEKSGDHAGAVRWRRRIADSDPVSSRSALALMRALVSAGDRTAALQHARVYEALVQQELGTAADPSIANYAAELRAEADLPAPAIKSPPRVEQAPIFSAPPISRIAHVDPVPERASSTPPEAVAAGKKYWWLIGTAVVAAVLAVVLFRGAGKEKLPALDANRIVVVPFRTSGPDSSVRYLGEGVVDLLAPMLTGDGGPSAVDSRTAISTWNRITHGREGTADDGCRGLQ